MHNSILQVSWHLSFQCVMETLGWVLGVVPGCWSGLCLITRLPSAQLPTVGRATLAGTVFPDHCAGRCWPGFQGGGNESQEGEMCGSALVHEEGGCAAFGRGSTTLQQGYRGKLPLVISTPATFAASSASLKREVISINGH